jgi:phospholipid/cholesterol/gamma-HCH transport system ATP-binding protein
MGISVASSVYAPIIEVDDLTARFGDNTILEKVSFQVNRGEILVILGGSGCGKSTLLKHMIGLYEPAAGKVILNGIDMSTEAAEELRQVKMGMGVLFQSGALFGSMTLAENLALPLREYTDLSPEEIDHIIKMKLALVNLAGYENHLPEEISGGMKKRAGLARAMVLDPSVLFFDEPSAGLDPISAAELDILIKSINTGLGTTMVVVTHELESIFSIAHRVIMLDKSARGIIAQGDPRELKDHSTDPRVSDFFNRRPGTGRQPKEN